MHPPSADAFDEWERVFSGTAACDATGAAAGDVEARLLAEARLGDRAEQVRKCMGLQARRAGLPARATHSLALPPPPLLTCLTFLLQAFAAVRDYEAGHALDAQALAACGYLERRPELVQAAQHLAAALGLGPTAQLWHAGGLNLRAVHALGRSQAAYREGFGVHMSSAARLPHLSAAAVALLDRCAAAGHQARVPALLAAACVALAAGQEGVPADTARLASQLDAQVGLQGHCLQGRQAGVAGSQNR